MYLLGTNTTSLQFWVFRVHFCILSPFTGWCWYSWPAWYHLRWISSSLKVQTLHTGRAQYLYRTAVWYSSFFLHFSETAQVNTRKPHKWLFKQKSSYACKHSLPFADYKFWNEKWNEITTTEKTKQKLLFCSKLSVLHTIYQNIFWNTNFKTSRENFFVFKKDPKLFHRKCQKCKNGLMLAVANVFFLHF